MRAGDIDRLLHGRRSAAAAPQQRRAAAECGQCHVVGYCRMLDADFVLRVLALVLVLLLIFSSTGRRQKPGRCESKRCYLQR